MVRRSNFEQEKMGKPIRVRLSEELTALLDALPNKSEFIREAVSRALEKRRDLEEIAVVREEIELLREEMRRYLQQDFAAETLGLLREEIAHLRKEVQSLKQIIETKFQGASTVTEGVKPSSEDEARIFTALESLLGLGKKER